ncbi:hypothetical protein OG429_01715 [Streptomyces sp. NBC_00190]|uniref:hypothetical protein n=1 Tax=unclassified Streptomyces TaxID=2593676 RepID=UPI002E294657|nr:hypothetical protein [Streptomyces sp. NBC_00190]WSZ38159.1 hypothetical protein OG239_04705 [Streptomyces sp. NBC_00868]
MSEHERRPEVTTPPSKAPGESGDREAPREAEEAVVPSRGDGDCDVRASGTGPGTDSEETVPSPANRASSPA